MDLLNNSRRRFSSWVVIATCRHEGMMQVYDEKERAYNKAYREANKEKTRAYSKAYDKDCVDSLAVGYVKRLLSMPDALPALIGLKRDHLKLIREAKKWKESKQ